MGIILKKDAKGRHYRFWYGAYKDSGKTITFPLNVEVKGKPPASGRLKDTGDAAFEKSRGKALAAFEQFELERKSKDGAEHVLEKLYAAKTGREPSYVKLEELAAKVNAMPRTRPLSQGKQDNTVHVIKEFAASCGKQYLYEVTDSDVAEFFEAQRKLWAWETVKGKMSLLSGAFARFLPKGWTNPFKSIIKRDDTEEAAIIHRAPLTLDQVIRVKELAAGDDMLNYITICGICTGARLKDICFMRKSCIDLKQEQICFLSSKTHTFCILPLFPELKSLCERLFEDSDPNQELLCPQAAAAYRYDRKGLVKQGKKLFATAIFGAATSAARAIATTAPDANPTRTAAELLDAINNARFNPTKTERLRRIVNLYVEQRKSFRTIEQETGLFRSSLSVYLKEVEELTKSRIIRHPQGGKSLRSLISLTRQSRDPSKRNVSVYGWASLRPTFCLTAIEAGVPAKQIMNAVGHKNYRTTLTFYANPTREHMRAQWLDRMSRTPIGHGAESTPTPDMAELVRHLTNDQRQALVNALLMPPARPTGDTIPA